MTKAILIVIDLQRDVCAKISHAETLIKKVNERIEQYRKAKKPILFIQHQDEELEKGSKGWQLDEMLDATNEDLYLSKTHANSFFRTELQNILTDLKSDSLEICGAQTEFCVNSTIVFAHGLGYNVFMKRGLSSTADNQSMTADETIDFYENHLWNHRFLEFLD